MTKEEYIKEMHERDRVVIFANNNRNIKGLVTFFITDDISKFNRDSNVWDIPSGENLNGKYIYLDRLITDRNSNIKANIGQLINYFKTRFPDKQIVYKSRGRNAREICLKSS